MERKDFEKYLNYIKFDDIPNHAHRDKLEQKLLASLVRQSEKKKMTKWSFNRGMTKLAAAAAVIIALYVVMTNLNGTNAWAKVIKAFNKVENVHMIKISNMPDGAVQKEEIWIRMPDCLYDDSPSVTIIDNGTDRMVIDKKKETTQFSDSFMPYKSVGEHYIFDSINIFREENQKEYEFKKIENESTETTIVFNMEFKYDTVTAEGKAWVDAKTMLPLKIELKLTSVPKEGEPASVEVLCNYDPIPDNVFAMMIPNGYIELPRKQKSALSGTVLDENGKPVANAVVFATDRMGQYSEKTLTDKSGRFVYNLPPEGTGFGILLPLMFRAYEPNVPDKVAWSIIKDPKTTYTPGGNIPYDVASVEIDGTILRSASGVILRMEPAGTIAGQVTDVNDKPIPNAQVRIVRCYLSDRYGNTGLTGINVLYWNGQEKDFGIVRTDKDGRYELNNLPEFWKRTEFQIHVNAHGYSIGESTLYAQGPIEHEIFDFQLYPYEYNLTISGVLKDNCGNLLAERYIYLRINGQDYRFSRTKTDQNGRFTLNGSPIADHVEVKAELSHNSMPPHEKEKYLSYVYYPDVIVDIGYQKNKSKYYVELTAVKPELTIEVEVKNSTGTKLPNFPVMLRSHLAPIPWEWVAEKNFVQRTDKDGYCKFTNVPWLDDLMLVLSSVNPTTSNDNLSGEERVKIANSYSIYKDLTIPIELTYGKKEYKVNVTMLTKEESQR